MAQPGFSTPFIHQKASPFNPLASSETCPPSVTFEPADFVSWAHRFRQPVVIVRDPMTGRLGLAEHDHHRKHSESIGKYPIVGQLPAAYPEWLGDRGFGEMHGVRFPYISGAMANGIATTRMVISMAKAGFLGFFGSAGLSLARVEAAIAELQTALGPQGLSWGINLINSPHEPALEQALVDLYLERGVRRISAAAYMTLSLPLVQFACRGLRRDEQGNIVREHFVFAKISHPNVARAFLLPAPLAMVQELVEQGKLTPEEGKLAALVPMAEDITCESDSGGHTDNRPMTALFSAIGTLRDEIAQNEGYSRPIRIGVAGGLGTPTAIAAAFSMGAAYVLTGSINQACVESGLDASGREMLAQADISDVVMAPAADMFEMGVEVQVLQRGTMFAVRGSKLLELYRSYPSWAAIPESEQQRVEKQLLRASFAQAWEQTAAFWNKRDPQQVERAEQDPKHKLALVFRSYLGLASRWAIDGQLDRRIDYQIWCGPAMGAFNRWVKGSFLEAPEQRTVDQVARNLMEGAAVVSRAHQFRSLGLAMPSTAFSFRPRHLA
jgi:trans-AT polyketide synthase, acyltransferase and oxidoreductase domains